MDLLEVPSLGLSWSERRWNLSFTTATALGYLNAFDFDQNEFTASQSLTGTYSYSFRRATITYSQSGQVGRSNLRLAGLAIPVNPGTPADTPPAPLPPNGAGGVTNSALIDQALWYGAAYGTLSAIEQASPRVSLGQFVRGSVTGSFGENEGTYPLQVSTGGGLSLTLRLGPRDSLSTQGYMDRTMTMSVVQQGVYSVGLSEGWSHMFSPRVTASISAGLSYTAPDLPTAGYGNRFYPTVSGTLNVLGSPVSLSVYVVPVVDPFTGLVDPRATAAVQYAKSRARWNWYASFAGTTSLATSPDKSVTTFATSAGLGYIVARDVTLNTSLGVSYQLTPAAAAENESLFFFGLLSLIYAPHGTRL
jgi:hypothetical protein